MKRVIKILAIAIIAFSCKSEKSNLKSDLESANLKGNVLKVERTIHNVNCNSACPAAEKVTANQSIYVYNNKGNLIESSDIDRDGNVTLNCKYVYNKHEVCNEINKYTGDKLVGKEIYVVEGDKLVEVKLFDEYGGNEKNVRYEYLADQLTNEKTLNSTGEIEGSVQYAYLNGITESQIKKDKDGNIISITKFKRNDHNDIIEYTINTPKDNMEYQFIFEYEYDSEGNWTKQTQFYNGGIESIIIRNIEYFKVPEST